MTVRNATRSSPRQGNIEGKGKGEHVDRVDALTGKIEKTGLIAKENMKLDI